MLRFKDKNIKGYDTDIVMCAQECPKGDTCFRHRMYQNYLADTREDKPRYIKMFMGKPEECRMPVLKNWEE